MSFGSSLMAAMSVAPDLDGSLSWRTAFQVPASPGLHRWPPPPVTTT